MIPLLIATRNPGKLRELAGILSDFPFRTITLEATGITTAVAETGTTFEENASLKAVAYRDESGLVTLADDSGLCVGALGGRPGVKSARFAGENATDEANMEKLLYELRDVPRGERGARFECAVVLALPVGHVLTFTAAVEGAIAESPAGEGGFGYDPVFVPEGQDGADAGLTMAQMSLREKAALSHRGKAARMAAEWLDVLVEKDKKSRVRII